MAWRTGFAFDRFKRIIRMCSDDIFLFMASQNWVYLVVHLAIKHVDGDSDVHIVKVANKTILFENLTSKERRSFIIKHLACTVP